VSLTDGQDLLPPGTPIDRTNCHREPIHVPGAIQSHGALLAADAESLRIVQASENAGALAGRPTGELLGLPLPEVLGADAVAELRERATSEVANLRPLPAAIGDRRVDAFGYRSADRLLVVELEETGDAAPEDLFAFQERVTRSLASLQDAASIEELLGQAAQVVRGLTGFDRVWAYRFEPDGHGVIVAEERHAHLPAFLGLHYPATDIPPQARALYLRNRLRFIHDVEAEPASLEPLVNPVTGEWLDLSPGVLRAVSPIHIAYLKNMGATASMSIALAVRGELWGLISAHHYSGPQHVPHQARAACELVGLVCSMQLDAREQLEASERRVALDRRRGSAIERVAAAPTIAEGLAAAGEDLLRVAGAEGAAVRIGGELHLVGATPGEEAVGAIIERLQEREEDVLVTDALAGWMPEAAAWAATASGAIAVALARRQGNYLVWFRPEYPHEVAWGGAKAVLQEGDGQRELGPEGSFAQWVQTVRGASRPWHPVEVESATALRAALGAHVLDRAEQLAALNAELARSNAELDAFAYAAAHDLKEPLRGIANFATFLTEDYHDTLDDEGRAQLDTIVRLTQRMGGLLDSLLEYSRVGRAELDLEDLTLGELLEESREMLVDRLGSVPVALDVEGADQRLRGDRIGLRHVLVNLLSNAVKYGERTPRRIRVAAGPADAEGVVRVCVTDNGIGIAPEHREAVFDIFRRLHARDAYGGGTGAGLTIARRIVERHGGEAWIDWSEPGIGSRLCFTVPSR
jgi:light-regulated signal transduction histidine kinase (bacteriophytochrome)